MQTTHFDYQGIIYCLNPGKLCTNPNYNILFVISASIRYIHIIYLILAISTCTTNIPCKTHLDSLMYELTYNSKILCYRLKLIVFLRCLPKSPEKIRRHPCVKLTITLYRIKPNHRIVGEKCKP